MAESYSDAAVYDCQVKACKTFFEDQLPTNEYYPLAEEDKPDDMKRFKGPIYDITGFDGQEVVRVLADIVNDKDKFKANKTFYLLIQGNPEDKLEELFRLQAPPKPLTDQPGSGIVFVRPRGKKLFKRGGAKSYEELNGALKAHYDIKDGKGKLVISDTKSFAKHIKQLFKNNVGDKDIPQATFEVYMILLFEIARRLVKSDSPTEMKKAFDILPMGCAIARFLKLLELGKCHFEDVFFPGGKFHCFSKGPDVRRKAIEKINAAILDITKESTATFLVFVPQVSLLHSSLPPPPATSYASKQDTVTKYLLQELQELFCSDERQAKMSSAEELAEEFKNLMSRISSQAPFWSNAEYTTAFDHFCT